MKNEQELKTREYTNGEVTIVWKPELCYHSKNCVHNLPDVFDPEQRPWINATGAGTGAIVQTVRKCPSGALTYYMNETGKPLAMDQQVPEKKQSVEVSLNGPLIIEGDIEVKMPDGEIVQRSRKTALCRCGASTNKPFCDGSHTKIDFKG